MGLRRDLGACGIIRIETLSLCWAAKVMRAKFKTGTNCERKRDSGHVAGSG